MNKGPLARALRAVPGPPPVEDGVWNPVPGRALRAEAARRVEDFLAERWRDARPERLECRSALCLTGSFARAEGGPRSDLDVVVIVEKETPGLAGVVRELLTALWASGLDVDHSVRTPAQCEKIAGEDLPALAALIDLVHVAGDAALSEGVIRKVREDLRRHAPSRIAELLVDAQGRWARWDLLHQVNEPQLKECRGGIRDLDLMRVLTAAWLADRPHGPLDEAHCALLDVRDALQAVTGRHSAKLLRSDQRAVALALGFEGDEAETHLRRLLTGAGIEIETAGRSVIDMAKRQAASWGAGALARRAIRKAAPGRGRSRRRSGLEAISATTALVDSRLDFTDPVFASEPEAVLDLAIRSALMDLDPAPRALDRIAAAAWRGDHAGREWAPRESAAFEAFLALPRGFVRAWSHLELSGVIEEWIPEFAQVRSRPQSADFHRWTVDRHLAETVARSNAARNGADPWEWPFPVELVRWKELRLAAFLHDLGKREGVASRDHPEVGAGLVEAVLRRLGLAQRSGGVRLLTERHLLLARLATEEDPRSARTADRLLDALEGDGRALAGLAVLTKADSQAAGPRAWTRWRASLITTCVRTAWARLNEDPAVR